MHGNKELCGVQGRASELSSTLEQQKIEAHHLQKQKQELVSEVEAHKLTVSFYVIYVCHTCMHKPC